MEKRIITISREIGSGGNTVGRLLAEKLGVKFYNKELVEHIAAESGFTREYVQKITENSREKGFLRYLFGTSENSEAMRGLNIEDFLWLCQYKVISRLADEGPCVIVGRNADYILRERDDVLNVFVYADEAFRKKRLCRLYGIGPENAARRIAEKDRQRRNNYKRYSGQEWGSSHNYDICLNSGELGAAACAEILAQCVKNSR